MKIAVYARYSSDLQNPKSIDDQVLLCNEYIEQNYKEGVTVKVYADAELTGSTLHNRTGMADLLQDAEKGLFDIIITEALDRLFRDLADSATVYRQLRYLNIKIITLHEGLISSLHIGLKGVMNEMALEDTKKRVRRAHRARATEGKVPAGVPYGYVVDKSIKDEKGDIVNGHRKIHTEQAGIVRQIFEEYASGKSVKAICERLNSTGVPSPSGKKWSPNTIKGSSVRRDGILRNDIYQGVLVYNKKHKVTNPATGKSRYVSNPEEEWVMTKIPHLRIINVTLWNVVQRNLFENENCDQNKKISVLVSEKKQHFHALTGFVFCGECGQIKRAANSTRYVCKGYYNRSCTNARGMKENFIVKALFQEIEKNIFEKSAWGSFVTYFEKKKLKREMLELKLQDTIEELNNLIAVIKQGVTEDAVISHINELHDNRQKLENAIHHMDCPVFQQKQRTTISAVLHEYFHEIHRSDFFVDGRYFVFARKLLGTTVKKIIMTPISNQRNGETIQIFLKSDFMPRSWEIIHQNPALFKTSPQTQNPT